MQAASRFIGFTAIRVARGLFPCPRPATVLAVLPSLARAYPRESCFPSTTPPRSSFTLHRRSLVFRRELTYPGFRPSSRPHLLASTSARPPKPSLCSVLRRSQPLDGFLRKLACRLISSRSRVQDQSCSGAHSLRAAVLSRRKPVPPCRCRCFADRLPDRHEDNASTSRPSSTRRHVTLGER